MDRIDEQIGALRPHIQPRWSEERAARVYAGIGQLRRRRMVARASGGVALAAAAAVWLAVGMPGLAPEGTGAELAQGTATPDATAAPATGTVRAAHRLRLADGSVAELFGERSELSLLENRAGHVALGLRTGRAHFDVVRNPEREFSVQAGAVRVVVLGTRFEVERRDGQVRVAVQHGRVRVETPDGVRILTDGEARLFSEAAADAGAEASAAPVETTVAAPEAEVAPAKAARTVRAAAKRERRAQEADWRGLIQEGDYAGAHAALRAGSEVPDAADALMDAADAARLSGHPQEAVGYLRRVVDGHGNSPVASLAAFTLGRVLLDRLGQPHDAAAAFAKARRLSPGGSLSQDALAREVEALSKAGSTAQARALAEHYLRSYPNGRRVQAVRLYGGLDTP